MSKYFNNCQNLNDLKKEYFRLIKKYHPDLAEDKSEFEQHNKICAEINSEYELILKRFPKSEKTNENYTIYEYIINGNEEAKRACNEIAYKISKLTIDYNFYHTFEGAKWWEEQTLIEINSAIELFWSLCSAKKIIGNEFAKLFELCGFNVEKMRRTIMFLSTGAISEKDIHTNLTSNNSIPFFDDNIIVENLPDYNSFLLLSKESTKKDTYEAWIEFCQRQRDNFYEKFYETIIQKIPSGKQK